jgi:hypothetical protein
VKILILEDSQERIKFFRDKLIQHELFIFEHVKDAEIFIENNQVTMMFLDHDLEGFHHIPSELPITGYEFVKFLVEKNLAKETTIIIHSMDVPGAKNMFETLYRNKYRVTVIPFAYLKFEE